MDAILKELGLQELTDLFTENDITPSVVVNLEESEFLSLGINTIGDRVRLREKCRDFLEDKNDHESPVVKRLKDFMKSRNTHVKRSLNQNNRKMKHTRKVIIGWKHHERKMTFRLVPPSKGGGKQEIDINRDLSLEETTEIFARSYFPNGRNEASGLSLENLTFFVATFTGQEIGNIVNAGQTFGELVDEIGTSPLRLYLHTKEKKSTIKEEAKCIQEANGDNELSENALHIPSSTIIDEAKDTRETYAEDELPDPGLHIPSSCLEDQTHKTEEKGEGDVVCGPALQVTNDLVLARPVRRKRTLRRAALRCNNTIAAVAQRPSSAMTVVDAVSSEEDRETSFPYIEIMDSEDEELQRVLESSMQESSQSAPASKGSVKNIIKEFKKKINRFDKQEIIIKRSDVLGSMFRALKRPSFDASCKLYIKFSGELGMDHGGPRRELFRLAIQELRCSGLFEGKGNQLFSHDLLKLNQGMYKLAGELVGLSIANDGPCIFICKELFTMMAGEEIDLSTLDPALVPDEESRQNLFELQKIQTYKDRDSYLVKKGDWLIEQGYSGAWRLNPKDVKQVVGILVKNIIYYRTSTEVEQFCLGLNKVCGLWDLIKSDPLPWLDVFCCVKMVTRSFFLEEVEILYSPEGSNRRTKEEETVYAWEVFLKDIEDKVVALSIQELLAFITGASEIPTVGFESQLVMEFYDIEGNETRLPFTSTCTLTFCLPRGCSCELLNTLFVRAVKESQGFHKI